jgi:hypothetical protein
MNKEVIYWTQKNGKLISVDDMTEDHLKNVLKLIIKNKELLIKNIEKKKSNTITLNGDISQMMNDMYEDNEFYDNLDIDYYNSF